MTNKNFTEPKVINEKDATLKNAIKQMNLLLRFYSLKVTIKIMTFYQVFPYS